MKYDASSIKVLDDPIAFIRRRPEMFVGVAEVQPEFLATSLAHALALGVRPVEIHHVGEWWAVVSAGGYTGLVLIGGQPNFARGAARCAELTSVRGCEMFQNNEIPAPAITHDPRIKAAVIADPGFTFLFGPADLKAVKVPVQLWSSEHGGAGVTPQSVAAVGQMLPSSPEYRLASNAAHFAFLVPCSPVQASTIPRICVDAPGFDRVAFHKEFRNPDLELH